MAEIFCLSLCALSCWLLSFLSSSYEYSIMLSSRSSCDVKKTCKFTFVRAGKSVCFGCFTTNENFVWHNRARRSSSRQIGDTEKSWICINFSLVAFFAFFSLRFHEKTVKLCLCTRPDCYRKCETSFVKKKYSSRIVFYLYETCCLSSRHTATSSITVDSKRMISTPNEQGEEEKRRKDSKRM